MEHSKKCVKFCIYLSWMSSLLQRRLRRQGKKSTIYPLYWHLGLESTKLSELPVLLILIKFKKIPSQGLCVNLTWFSSWLHNEDLTFLIGKLKQSQMSEQHSAVKRHRAERRGDSCQMRWLKKHWSSGIFMSPIKCHCELKM